MESDADSRAQILESVQDLAALLGAPVWSFAYPNGRFRRDFGEREQRTLARHGVRLAFSTDSGFFHRHTNPLAIPRVGFSCTGRETTAWVRAKLLLTPLWDPLRESLRQGREAREAIERRKITSLRSQGARASQPEG
jgi:hypothetical protein